MFPTIKVMNIIIDLTYYLIVVKLSYFSGVLLLVSLIVISDLNGCDCNNFLYTCDHTKVVRITHFTKRLENGTETGTHRKTYYNKITIL